MKKFNLSKDQIQKLGLSMIGVVVLLYVYFSFFLGPLNASRNSMTASINELQAKLGSSKNEMAKATNLENQAREATTRYAALTNASPEGAPIAWFPPRMKSFFANQHIDKAVARLENSAAFKQPELAAWLKYNWLIDLPQADYATLGQAIAELENAEPLLAITKLSIHAAPDQPEFQQVVLTATNTIQKQ